MACPVGQQASSLGNRPTDRPTRVDDEVNSEVASGFVMILNVAEEVTT